MDSLVDNRADSLPFSPRVNQLIYQPINQVVNHLINQVQNLVGNLPGLPVYVLPLNHLGNHLFHPQFSRLDNRVITRLGSRVIDHVFNQPQCRVRNPHVCQVGNPAISRVLRLRDSQVGSRQSNLVDSLP